MVRAASPELYRCLEIKGLTHSVSMYWVALVPKLAGSVCTDTSGFSVYSNLQS